LLFPKKKRRRRESPGTGGDVLTLYFYEKYYKFILEMIIEGLFMLSVATAPAEGVTDKGAFPHLPEGICFSMRPRQHLHTHPDCPVCVLTNDSNRKLVAPRIMSRRTLQSLDEAVQLNLYGIDCRYPA